MVPRPCSARLLKIPVCAINDEGQPALSWDTVTGAASYDVFSSESADGEFIKVATVTEAEYADTAAKTGKTYYYKVCAVSKKNNAGALSEAVSATCVMVRPEPVVGNRYVDGKPTLSWAPVEGATSYQVYRAEEEDGSYVRVFNTTGTTYTHVSAEVGETYYYKVKAVFAEKENKFSQIVKATCVKGQFVVTATTRSIDGKPTLSWKPVPGAASYEVYRSNTKDGAYSRVFTTTGTSYTHMSSVVGKTYYYKVKVVDADKTGIFGQIVSAKCVEANFVVTTGNRIVDGKPILKWDKDTSVEKYQVYRSATEDGKYVRVFTTTGNTYTHVSATVDGTYFYKVKAILKNGSTVFSDVVENSCICGQPVVETGNREADGKPTLKWEDVEGAASYQVYRATEENGKYVRVFTTEGNSYTHVSAASDVTYYYKVRAISDSGNNGIFSKIVSNSVLVQKTETQESETEETTTEVTTTEQTAVEEAATQEDVVEEVATEETQNQEG